MKAFDISKYRKSITKSIKEMSVGFRDPDTWISTGNYMLNKRISGSFYKGVPLGKVTMVAGDPGSGKSYICSANIIKNAQEQGIFAILIDTENALDKLWLNALGVNTDDDKLLKLNLSKINDVASLVSNFVSQYRTDYMGEPEEERPKVLFVVDSLGMLLTPTEINQFESGDMKGDKGLKAKQLKSFIVNCVNMLGDLNVGLVCTNHTYASQDMFNPDDVVSGGNGMLYASSIVIGIKKWKLKDDTKKVAGIRATCKVMKTRFAKPFETVDVEIPYNTGMNPYSGLVDYFLAQGILTKHTPKAHKIDYVQKETGEVIKLTRNEWDTNTDDCIDIVLKELEKNE